MHSDVCVCLLVYAATCCADQPRLLIEGGKVHYYNVCTVSRQKQTGGRLGEAKTHTATNLLQLPFVQKVTMADRMSAIA